MVTLVGYQLSLRYIFYSSPMNITQESQAIFFQKIKYIIKLGRPKFLIYSSLSYTFGLTLYLFYENHAVSPLRYIAGLFGVWAIHLMTHYCNEYYDYEADIANQQATKWTGGSRILVDGKIRKETALSIAYLLLFVAIGISALMPNFASRVIVVVAIFFGWFYTAPPFKFNYRALGEMAVGITLTYLVPMLGFTVQSGKIEFKILLLLLPAFLIQYSRMMIMNLADYKGDIEVNKKTMIVLLGVQQGIQLYGWLHSIAYSAAALFTYWELIPLECGLTIFFTLPISIWQYYRISRGAYENPKVANSITFWASTHSILIVFAIYIGVVVNLWSKVDSLNGVLGNQQNLTLLFCSLPILVYAIAVFLQFTKNRVEK